MLDDSLDDLEVPSIEGLQKSQRALQTLTKQLSERARKQQRAKEKLAEIQLECNAADLTANVDDDQQLEGAQDDLHEKREQAMQELDQGDQETGGPEPEVWMPALEPVQGLPPLHLEGLSGLLDDPCQLLGLPAHCSSSSSGEISQLVVIITQLLLLDGRLATCPSEAAAQSAFSAVCYGPAQLALAAYTRFMAWCGEPEVVTGSALSGLSQMYAWCGGAFTRPPGCTLSQGTALADSLAPTSIAWLPGAEDTLQALAAMGVLQARVQQHLHHQHQQQQQQKEPLGVDGAGDNALAFRHANLPLLLQLLSRFSRAHAAGRVDASALAANQARFLQLLLSLLSLMLDQRALITCRAILPEALDALLQLPSDTAWDRLVRDKGAGSLLDALSGGLGPSHRSAVCLLSQLPQGSHRGRVLRQLGGLTLMGKLLQRSKVDPPRSVSSKAPEQLSQLLQQQVQALLGPQDKIRVLLKGLSVPPQLGGALQVWQLSSVLEAAYMVLWVDVVRPGAGLGHELHHWLLQWLTELDTVLDKRLSTHLVRKTLSGMENAFRFAQGGRIVGGGA